MQSGPVSADLDAKVNAPRGIQRIEVGGLLLQALARQGRPMALKDLARAADMAPAKAHPYLVSFGKIGMVEQDESARYGLGPLAVQLGLIGLQQVDPVRLASAELPALARRIGQTVAIAVWGTQGPTIVRIEAGPQAIHVSMRHGSTVSVRTTAAGKLFAAFGHQRDEMAAVLAQEDAGRPLSKKLAARFDAEIKAVRIGSIAVVVDQVVVGVSAIAAPVLDAFGQIALALTAIGPSSTLDTDVTGPVARELQAAAQALSHRLGT